MIDTFLPKMRIFAGFAFLVLVTIFGYRSYIMATSEMQPHKIIKKECSVEFAYNGSSSKKKNNAKIWIEVGGKTYKVSGVTSKICRQYSNGDTIRVYHDAIMDIYFIDAMAWVYGALAVSVFFTLTYIKGFFKKSTAR